MKLFDLTHSIYHNMPVFPGETETVLLKKNEVETDGYNNHRLKISLHTGTHLDSPLHFLNDGKFVSEYCLESFYGNTTVIDARNEAKSGNPITFKTEYEKLISPLDIVFICTNHSKLWNTESYYADYPVLSTELVDFLVDKKIKILGVDTPSPDKEPYPYHYKCFKEGIFFLENLTNLENLLSFENIEVMAFPLKIKADSSIVRVVAKCQ